MTAAAGSDPLLESMSTYQLAAAIHDARSQDQDDGVHPSPRLLRRMAREWDERPDQDRFTALSRLHDLQDRP